MDSTIIVAMIVGGLSFIGTFINAKYTSNVKVTKLEVNVDNLKTEVRKHNSIIDRTYKLEEKVGIIEHDIKNIEQNIK